MAKADESKRIRDKLYTHADIFPDGYIRYCCSSSIDFLPNHILKFNGEKRTTPLHNHVNLELIYIFNGKVAAEIDGEVIYPHKNNLLIINPNEWHKLTMISPLSYYCIVLDTDIATPLGVDITELTFMRTVHNKTVSRLIDMLTYETDRKNDFYKQNISSILTILIIYLIRNCLKNQSVLENPSLALQGQMVTKIQKYISDNYDKRITLDEISSYVGFNKYHIVRTFKKITGTTVHEAINTIKLKEANKLLEQSSMKICDIAETLGFENASHFSALYKKYIGSTPLEYRKNKGKH